MKLRQLQFPLNKGLNVYSPDLTTDELVVRDVKNAVVRLGRYRMANELQEVQTRPQAGDIMTLAATYDINSLASNVYAFGEVEPLIYRNDSEEFEVIPIPWYTPRRVPTASVNWMGKLYATRPGFPLTRLDGSKFHLVDSAYEVGRPNLSARYAIINANHLMVANIRYGAGQYLGRVQWSDIYLPEQWKILEATEADFFDVTDDGLEVTGLSNQRGAAVIYTVNGIWRAVYERLPIIYRFEQIFTGIGNVYHYAQIQVKDVDFFIGQDNIYILDGLAAPQPIGTPIWEFFINDLKDNFRGNMVIAGQNERFSEVFWTYESKDGSLQQIVFNYLENQWSRRGAQEAYTWLLPPTQIRTYRTINSFDTLPDDAISGGEYSDEPIDGDFQFEVFGETGFAAGKDGQFFRLRPNRFAQHGSDKQEGFIETFEFSFNSVFREKEHYKTKVLLKKVGNPTLVLKIGTRKSQSVPVEWTTVPLTDEVGFLGESMFHKRLAGKFIRFRLEWINGSENDYVEEIYGIGFEIYINDEDKTEK